MSTTQQKVVGYGLLVALSVILFEPLAEWMNVNISTGTIGDAIGSFFWIIYPIAILYLIYKLLVALLYG